jgi:pepF/M3 family oligoendopeptidase
MENLPHWDLDPIYAGLGSKELASGFADLGAFMDRYDKLHAATLSRSGPSTPAADLARALDEVVTLFNGAFLLATTLQVYVESLVSTDSFDTAAAKKLSELEIMQVRLRQCWTRFQGWIGTISPVLPKALAQAGPARAHSFILTETAQQATYLMGEREEMLAAELTLSGANAWSKLQRTITSQITVDFELDGKVQSLPVTAIVNLRTHPEEPVRRRAFEAEMKEWQKVREPLAACMNGLKGSSNTMGLRRGRKDCLHAPIDGARIDRATLDTLMGAVKDSLPLFRRYFLAKAKRMGKEKLAWWDLFAPAGAVDRTFTWEQTRTLILETFGRFAPSLRSLAERAFEKRWMDAEPRKGKSGGAFCSPVPSLKESRILANFDGTLELVSTIAHELGHAYHNDCAYRAGKTELQQMTPMTLAETASIMCESIVTGALLERVQDPREQLAVLENDLVGAAQTVVDIYARFLFEKEVMERRQASELSADDLCDIMDRAQAAAYGDGLDERFRHPYMWTWKPHYYIASTDFYNFPYTFGLLFSTGLYAVYSARGPSFVPDYEALLASTGEGTAADLAARFGIDIRTRAFWDRSLEIIRVRIDRYCAL